MLTASNETFLALAYFIPSGSIKGTTLGCCSYFRPIFR
jgi:hypothetical protein